ncbi:MAG: hypothetical protein SF097_16390 [Acidobacteriota bacterium]|nr:hypothetical protein [Acidobacteriota bacterium]
MAETRTRDLWDKIDILAKIMTPVVLFTFGTLYNMHQTRINEAQKASDRVATLVKSLSSPNIEERKTALALLNYEKSKHPGAVPDDLLTNILPALVQLAKSEKDADVAKTAEKLANDVVANVEPGLVTAVQNQVAENPGRIFTHIVDEGQRSDARRIAGRFEDKGYYVPVSEKVAVVPAVTEVRFFHSEEAQEAAELATMLQSLGVAEAKVSDHSRSKNASRVRKRTFEIWFSSKSLRQPLPNNATPRTGSESQ